MRLIHSPDRTRPTWVTVCLLSLVVHSGALAQRVVVEETRLTVSGTVAFATGSDRIAPTSYPLLDEVVAALNANPRFTQVRVEGHTDDRGAEQTNYRLSEARARAVKDYLVAHGVDEGRMRAEGFGPEQPIADNSTEAGRRKNRRVAFVVVEISGRRVVADRQPLAKLSARTNQVDAREPTQARWREADVGLGLFRAWRVQSRERAAAEVTFRDASQIGMRENTLVIIYGAVAKRTKRFEARAELESGALRSRLAELAGEKPSVLAVATPSAEAELAAGSSLLSVDERKTTRVAHHRGKAVKVWGKEAAGKRRKRSISLKAGFGSKVAAGSDPSPPKPLPPAPTWAEAGDITAIRTTSTGGGAQTVRFALPTVALSDTLSLRVEIARSAMGADVVHAVTSRDATDVAVEQLPDGDYFVRVAAIDADAFEGEPSAPRRLRVRTVPLLAAAPGAAPQVTLGAPIALAGGLACGASPATLDSTLRLHRLGAQRLLCGLDGVTDAATLQTLQVEVVPPPQGVIVAPSEGLVPGRANELFVVGLEAETLTLKTTAGAETEAERVGERRWRALVDVPAGADAPFTIALLDGERRLASQSVALAATPEASSEAAAAAASADAAAATREADAPPESGDAPVEGGQTASPAAAPSPPEPSAQAGGGPQLWPSPLWGLAVAVGGVGAFVVGAVVYSFLSEPSVLGVAVPPVALIATSTGFVILGLVAISVGAGLVGAAYYLDE